MSVKFENNRCSTILGIGHETGNLKTELLLTQISKTQKSVLI